MARTRIIPATAALLLLTGIAATVVSDETDTTRSAASVAMPADEKHRGVSWVAGREITPLDIRPLVEGHVNWIVQTPFGWQRSIDSPQIGLATKGGVFWGETDQGLAVTAKLARKRGIRTLLKPHIWITGGGWRGAIKMTDEADWTAWFESYRRFIMHYARFAQEHGIEALCVGTELHSTLAGHEQQWRKIIAEVRSVYDGRLTYAANWYAEFEEIPFWDELDFIGIQAYFSLSENAEPTLEALMRAWQVPLKQIERVQARHRKPVLFTEIGYRSIAATSGRPWEWPKHGEAVEINLGVQALCYEAFFRTFWERPWFAGAYWWKWYPSHQRAGGPRDAGFTPQNKPAERVMAEWFGRRASK